MVGARLLLMLSRRWCVKHDVSCGQKLTKPSLSGNHGRRGTPVTPNGGLDADSDLQELFEEAVNFTSTIDYSISHTPDTVRYAFIPYLVLSLAQDRTASSKRPSVILVLRSAHTS